MVWISMTQEVSCNMMVVYFLWCKSVRDLFLCILIGPKIECNVCVGCGVECIKMAKQTQCQCVFPIEFYCYLGVCGNTETRVLFPYGGDAMILGRIKQIVGSLIDSACLADRLLLQLLFLFLRTINALLLPHTLSDSGRPKNHNRINIDRELSLVRFCKARKGKSDFSFWF